MDIFCSLSIFSSKISSFRICPVAAGLVFLLSPAFLTAAPAKDAPAPAVPPTSIDTNLESIVAERKADEAKNVAAVQAQLMEAIKSSPDSAATPMTKLALPIANHANGRVKAMLSADYALFPAKENDYLRAKNITIELFNPLGELEGIFLSDNAVFDSSTKMGYCDGPVRLLYRRVQTSPSGVPQVDVLEMTGTNLVMDVENDNTKITIPVSPVVRFDGFMDGLGKVFKK